MGRDEGKVRARGGNVPDVMSRCVVKEKLRDYEIAQIEEEVECIFTSSNIYNVYCRWFL